MFDINGVVYASWDQVPEDVRRQLSALPDADGNGIPDLIEPSPATTTTVRVDKADASVTDRIETSTRTYVVSTPADLAALPPNIRAMLTGTPQDAPAHDAFAAVASPQDATPQDAPVQADRDGVATAGAPKRSWWQRVSGG
jgi:hypothetical protein